MKVLLIDPGLSNARGHNAAIAHELHAALSGCARLRIAASRSVQPSSFGALAAALAPAFGIDGYAKFGPNELTDAAVVKRLRAAIDADVRALQAHRYDVLLMPTAYPMHLEALARCRDGLGSASLTVGMLMPPQFWAADDSVVPVLEHMLLDSMMALSERPGTVFYCETGSYALGLQRLSLPVLLPPVSAATAQLMARLQSACTSLKQPLRFGFFGQPFLSKGFGHVLTLAQSGMPAHARLVVRLPAGYDELCAQLNAAGPHIDATSRPMTNGEYLEQMAHVDVVIAAYDPAHYALKMSGVVPEAICLGKPLVVSSGCTAIVDFLDRHAPGSFAAADYGIDGLAAAMNLPLGTWQRLSACAQASAAAVRTMKDAHRYLRIAGISHELVGASTAQPNLRPSHAHATA